MYSIYSEFILEYYPEFNWMGNLIMLSILY